MWQILRVAVQHAIGYGATRYLPTKLQATLRIRALSGPQRLRCGLEQLGGTFVKLGQMLALQSDALPLEYCDALFDLLDHVEPAPYLDMLQVFREELGREPTAVFDRFEEEPIATASIGQVYRAELKGKTVAVKIQRPDAAVRFAQDIVLMRRAVALIVRLHLGKLYWLIEPTSEFIRWTAEELDFRHEARHAQHLRRCTRNHPRGYVPAVYMSLTTRRVLVTEFLKGVTVLQYLRTYKEREMERNAGPVRGFNSVTFAANVIDNFLADAFRYGIFHADLHPANLMILDNSVVGYIDFGITGTLSPHSRRQLVALTLAYARGDINGICRAFFTIATPERGAEPARFRRELQAMTSGWYGKSGREARFRKSITMVMFELLTLSRRTRILPARDVVKYIRSAIAVDGLIKRLSPGFDVGRHLEAVCNQQLRWQARRTLLSLELLAPNASSATALATRGLLRISSLLDKLNERTYRPVPRQRVGERASLAESLIALLLFSSLMFEFMSRFPAAVQIAEAAVVTCSGIAFVGWMWRARVH